MKTQIRDSQISSDKILYLRCSRCRNLKPATKFKPKKNRRTGRCSHCYKCVRDYPSNVAAREKIRQRQRETFIAAMGANTYDELLDLRHTDLYNWLIRNGMPSARDRAKTKGIPFTLTRAWALAQARNGPVCAVTGVALRFREKWRGVHPFNPSLDRINPRKGYTPDNVRIVALWVNYSKNSMSDANFKICVGIAADALWGTNLVPE